MKICQKMAYTWDSLLYETGEESISRREEGKEKELWNGEEYIQVNEGFHRMEE